MKVKQFEFNMLPVNTYVVWDEHTHEASVIDAGCYTPKECETLKEFISEEGLTVKYLLNTHLHFDHIFGKPQRLSDQHAGYRKSGQLRNGAWC